MRPVEVVAPQQVRLTLVWKFYGGHDPHASSFGLRGRLTPRAGVTAASAPDPPQAGGPLGAPFLGGGLSEKPSLAGDSCALGSTAGLVAGTFNSSRSCL